MPGDSIGPYRIERKLGVGGMGEVYLAFDDRLNRHVAIKQLRPDRGAAPEIRERFRREAQAVARLSHHAIVQVYDILVVDDLDHIVMEYVEGKALSALLSGGPLPLPKVIKLAREICAGLLEAHSKGIVHRDLKAENVIVTQRGQAKILDFGLAKSLFEAEPGLSVAGVVVGTYRSMSPEQASGQDVDHRSDLFSFGVLLYEATTGKSPFQGPSALAVLSKLLTQRPMPAKSLQPNIGDDLSNLIDRLLEKLPELRPQSAQEVADALERIGERVLLGTGVASTSSTFFSWSTGHGVTPESSTSDARAFNPFVSSSAHTAIVEIPPHAIAVLPFVNMSADPENEYFSDGLTEDLTVVLAQLPGLRVASRTSAFAYKGKNQTAQAVGTALQVDSVLTGSVRKAGRRLRITAQVSRVRDGQPVWSERYDRDLEDVFEVQDEIARTIAEALKLKLVEGEPLKKPATLDVEAYNLYLKGRYHWNRRYAGGLQKGMEFFRQAIAADPNFAQPYAGLADSFAILAFYGYVPPHDGSSKALTAARQALALDSELAEAHTSLALVTSFFEWDWKLAEKEFQKAIALNPAWGTAYSWYSFHLHALGHYEASRRAIEKAYQTEPLSVGICGAYSYSMYLHGDYDRGAQVARDALEIDNNFAAGHVFLGWNLLGAQAWPEAIEALEKGLKAMGGLSLIKGMLGYCHARSGNTDRAREILAELLDLRQQTYVATFFVAFLYLGLDDLDNFFAWLDQCYEERNNWLIFLEVLPTLAPIRDEPRLRALSSKIGLDQYHRRQ